MENLEPGNEMNVSLNLIGQYGDSDSDSDDLPAIYASVVKDQKTVALSPMVLKNNIINACVHGPLPRGSSNETDTTKHMIIDSAQRNVVEYEVTEYREPVSLSSSDSSDVESVKDAESGLSDDDDAGGSKAKDAPVCVEGEDGLDELPAIEDLTINVPAEECELMGTIISIIGRLVVVEGLPGKPCVDLDSVLFLEKGAKTLGTIHDVFGNINEPRYTVRFNSREHVTERGVELYMEVYYAPNTNHTQIVFLPDLLKMKGSDASWMKDMEVPPDEDQDFSDDEEERKWRRAQKKPKNKNKGPKPPPAPANPYWPFGIPRTNVLTGRAASSTSFFNPLDPFGSPYYSTYAMRPSAYDSFTVRPSSLFESGNRVSQAPSGLDSMFRVPPPTAPPPLPVPRPDAQQPPPASSPKYFNPLTTRNFSEVLKDKSGVFNPNINKQ